MLPGDSEEEARRFASSLGTSRARHFYDAARRAGIIYAEDYFHEVMREAFVTAPDDSSYRARLIRQLNAPPRDHPVWDAVLMFRPGVEWGARAPRPDWWARQ